MLDGLQMCENEPNFDSNIIHTRKRQQQNGPKMDVFSVSEVVREAGGGPALASGERYIQEPGVRQLRNTAPHRAAPRPFKKGKKNVVVSRQSSRTPLVRKAHENRPCVSPREQRKMVENQSVREVNNNNKKKNAHAKMRRVNASTTEWGVQCPVAVC